MESNRPSNVTNQAIALLNKIGVEVKQSRRYSDRYEFEYKDNEMFFTMNTRDDLLCVGIPVYLPGMRGKICMEIFRRAEAMFKDRRRGCIIFYEGRNLARVEYLYIRPKHIQWLEHQTLVKVLDKILDVYYRFWNATAKAEQSVNEMSYEEICLLPDDYD